MEKVECVVVGAGPAGSACALALARKGVETVLLERGAVPGEKNVASFVLFTPVLRSMIPGFEREAPLERPVCDQSFLYLGEKDYFQVRMNFQGHRERRLAYTAFRSRFDAWFAEQAREAGAELLAGVNVTGLVVDDGRVRGVRIGDEELMADVVVGADGLHTVVGREAGLVEDDIRTYMLGVKEVLDLAPEVIEERFQLPEGEGTVFETVGYPLDDIAGATTLYTNRDSLSLAVFGWVDAIKERGVNLYDRLQQLKEHPYIHSLVNGSTTREYQSHMLANGGRVPLKRLYSDGVLLCGEAGGLMSYMYVGVPPGMLSGLLAAETVAHAKKRGDYSAHTLKKYISLLGNTSLLKMLYDSRRASDYLVASGRERLPIYVRHLISSMEKSMEGEVVFLEPEHYSPLKHFYFDIAEERTPAFLRGPIRAALRCASPVSSLLRKRKMIRRLG